jgi:hypothetical protein
MQIKFYAKIIATVQIIDLLFTAQCFATFVNGLIQNNSQKQIDSKQNLYVLCKVCVKF